MQSNNCTFDSRLNEESSDAEDRENQDPMSIFKEIKKQMELKLKMEAFQQKLDSEQEKKNQELNIALAKSFQDVEKCLLSVKEDSNDLKRKIQEIEENRKKDEAPNRSGGPYKSPTNFPSDPKVTGFFNMGGMNDTHTHTHTHSKTCPLTGNEGSGLNEHTANFLKFVRKGSQDDSDEENVFTNFPSNEKIHNMSREELETKFNILRSNNYKKSSKHHPKLSKALLTPASGQLPSEGIAVMAGIAGIYERMDKQEQQQHTQNLYMGFVNHTVWV
eukprot:GHVR01072997.1.p1 GENE.GHVR01072997.1~~GHVR01072997.1.p1  ORF type:complete len:274 (-),score=24.37 GHVR01072997.1:139-960(-)